MQAAIAAARVWNFILPTTVGLASIFGQIFQCHQEGGLLSREAEQRAGVCAELFDDARLIPDNHTIRHRCRDFN